jgi:hypothetical protein
MASEITSPSIKFYKTTKEACQKTIDINIQEWDAVCSQCGGKLEPIETVDNSNYPTFWAGCMACERFNWGVPRYAQKIAAHLVDNHNYVHYSHMGNGYGKEGAEKKYWRDSQIGGAAYLVRQIVDLYKKEIETK